jgi:hypothetical protein
VYPDTSRGDAEASYTPLQHPIANINSDFIEVIEEFDVTRFCRCRGIRWCTDWMYNSIAHRHSYPTSLCAPMYVVRYTIITTTDTLVTKMLIEIIRTMPPRMASLALTSTEIRTLRKLPSRQHIKNLLYPSSPWEVLRRERSMTRTTEVLLKLVDASNLPYLYNCSDCRKNLIRQGSLVVRQGQISKVAEF